MPPGDFQTDLLAAIAAATRGEISWPALEYYLRRWGADGPTLGELVGSMTHNVVADEADAGLITLAPRSPGEPAPDYGTRPAPLEAPPSGPEFGAADSRFVKLHQLTVGAVGVIFVAQDREVPRLVGMKELRPEYADHGGMRARFAREAEITGALEHPGVIPVYGYGTHADGRPFLAMRLVLGGNLAVAADRFHRARRDGRARFGGSAFRRLMRPFAQACRVVAYAHHRGVVHRDLKPANIMLGLFGNSYVVDWGLGKTLGEGVPPRYEEGFAPLRLVADAEDTNVGTPIGTPAFMSPEQARVTEDVGVASDIYLLGATLYYLLTGAAPFGADRRASADGRDFVPVEKRCPDAPPGLVAVCRRAMAPEPRERFPYAGALTLAVRRALAKPE